MEQTRSLLSARDILDSLPEKLAPKREAYRLADDLYVNSGEIIGISGPSGIGKTELIRLLVDGVPESIVATTKYIPQELPFFPQLSLKYNIKTITEGRNVNEINEAAPHLAAILKSRAHWSIFTLSGGEKRQLALVSAACSNPRLLIIDETFISLDSERLLWSLSYLRKEVAANRVGGVLIISHDDRVLQRCDRVFELMLIDGMRTIKAVEPPEVKNDVADQQIPVPASTAHRRSNHIWSFFRFLLGTSIALIVLLLLLISPRLWGARELAAVIPSVSEVLIVLMEKRAAIIAEGWWSLQNSTIALFGIPVLSSFLWLTSSISKNIRRVALSTWIGLQTVPVVLFSPLVVILWGYHGRILEIAIAIFIAVFPFGLIGVRAISTTPRDILLAHRARTTWRRLTVGVRYAFGDIARGFVACAPLPAVGVVVAEYLIQRRGLGGLVYRGLVENITFAQVYAYVLACVVLASILVLLATLLVLLVLPRDITID